MGNPRADKVVTKARPNPLAGWDISFAAFALACMTAGFWRLWPAAATLEAAPLGPVILKAGVAALGFVAIASRWEDALRGIVRNPLALVLIGLACASSVWAINPSEALRQSIILLVVWGFGIGLALRFRTTELAEICGFAGIFALTMQATAHKGIPIAAHFDGDLAFALIGSLWAATRVASRRMIWLVATGLCAALAFAAGDWASLGAGLGFALGLGLAFLGSVLSRRGAVSVIITAWAIVASIVAVTVFFMFGAASIADHVGRYFTDLGSHMMLGQGFGAIDQSITGSLAGGLGILGVSIAALVVVATLCQVLFGNPSGGAALRGQVAVFFASLGAILLGANEVAILGPICILVAASSFSISLACARRPVARKPVLERSSMPLQRPIRRPQRQSTMKTVPPSELTNLGLRPRQ